MSAGKQFESQLVKSFRHHYPLAFVERFTDGMTGNGKFSVKTPPDMIVVGAGRECLLVEAKATKGTSVRYDRVDGHQLAHLLKFDNTLASSHGCVAILQYNGLRGGARVYNGWLVPIERWDAWSKGERKSLSFQDPRLEKYRMTWVPVEGCWDLHDAVRAVSD